MVHDPYSEPRLPLADSTFDAAVCAASAEFLAQPLRVAADGLRARRPGGRFVVAFPERWFPAKAVALWTALHPYKRPDPGTEVFRALPRPVDDPPADHIA